MTPTPRPNAPGFTPAAFENAVHRAHCLGLRVTERVGPVAFVTSASKPGQVHRVTRFGCDCESHRRRGTCAHRALCLFLCDVMGGFGQPKPAPANVVNFVHCRPTKPAA